VLQQQGQWRQDARAVLIITQQLIEAVGTVASADFMQQPPQAPAAVQAPLHFRVSHNQAYGHSVDVLLHMFWNCKQHQTATTQHRSTAPAAVICLQAGRRPMFPVF